MKLSNRSRKRLTSRDFVFFRIYQATGNFYITSEITRKQNYFGYSVAVNECGPLAKLFSSLSF